MCVHGDICVQVVVPNEALSREGDLKFNEEAARISVASAHTNWVAHTRDTGLLYTLLEIFATAARLSASITQAVEEFWPTRTHISVT